MHKSPDFQSDAPLPRIGSKRQARPPIACGKRSPFTVNRQEKLSACISVLHLFYNRLRTSSKSDAPENLVDFSLNRYTLAKSAARISPPTSWHEGTVPFGAVRCGSVQNGTPPAPNIMALSLEATRSDLLE